MSDDGPQSLGGVKQVVMEGGECRQGSQGDLQVNLHHNERSEWRGKYIFYLLQDWKDKILPRAMHHAPCMAPLYGKGVPPLPGLWSQPPPGLVNLCQAIILFCHLDIFYYN